MSIADELMLHLSQPTLVHFRILLQEPLYDCQPENGVAEEFQRFVML